MFTQIWKNYVPYFFLYFLMKSPHCIALFLDDQFPDQWIGRRSLTQQPLRSPDLNSLYIFSVLTTKFMFISFFYKCIF